MLTNNLRQAPDARRACTSMEKLLYPKRIAVLGATERAGAPAGIAFRNLLDAGWRGNIFPVHPSAETVFGVPAFRKLADLPVPVDCVVIGLAADKVVSAIDEAADAGIGAAVVLASGFAELGSEGRKRQAELVAAAERAGMAVCGPNCLGLINVGARIPLYAADNWASAPKGRLALLSHSGSGAITLSATGRLGFSHVVSSGNSAVCDLAEYLEFLADDEQTGAAALFLETIRDPAAFERAMEAMHKAGKPVVCLRIGRSSAGAAASAAHTGTLVGSNDAFDTFFRRTGVIAVDDMDELIEASCLVTGLKVRAPGNGVGLINCSGGEVAHACDIAETIGLSFPPLAETTTRELAAVLPAFATPGNPLDVTGAVFADRTMYPAALKAFAGDPSVGFLAVVQDAPAGLSEEGATSYRRIAEDVAEFARSTPELPVAFISNLSGTVHPHVRQPLDEAGVPVLTGTRAALKAVLNVVSGGRPVAAPEGLSARPQLSTQPEWIMRLKTGRPFSEHEAKAFLRDHGIPTTREILATSEDECTAAAAKLGYPVVLKIASEDLPHKTEVGGVALHLTSEAEVRDAFGRIMASVGKHAPKARIDGILVQEMIGDSIEAIVGLARHHPFGLAVVVGSGGIMVELLRDAALGLPPLSDHDARGLVDRTRLATLLDGFRGAAPADRKALETILTAVSDIALAYGEWIEALDLNPVAVLQNGQGACVLDALIVPVGQRR